MNNKEIRQKLMSVKEVAESFRQAMESKKPICLVCVGDGDMYFIARNDIPCFSKGKEQWERLGRFKKHLTNQQIKDEMLDCIAHADIIGLTPHWPLSVVFLEYYSFIPTNNLCDGYIGRGLHFTGLLYDILKNKRVYLVGNSVDCLLPVLEKFQIDLAGYTHVNDFEDIPRVKDCLSLANFDLAVVSAGLTANIIVPWITRTLHRCALDFGSAIYWVSNSYDFIGAKRNDFTIFKPEAKINFRLTPDDVKEVIHPGRFKKN